MSATAETLRANEDRTPHDPVKMYQAPPCHTCGDTRRYIKGGECVMCKSRRNRSSAAIAAAQAKRFAAVAACNAVAPCNVVAACNNVIAVAEPVKRTRMLPAPAILITPDAPLAGILITRLPARFVCLVPGGGQKFAVEGFVQDFLWCWDAAQVPGLSHGDPGEMRWAINPAIAAEPNWYFVPTGAK